MPLRCRIFGHRYRFTTTDTVMRWSCEREGCTAAGSKRYQSADAAARYAAAFDREDRDELGRRAPLFGTLPLRVWYWIKRRSQKDA